MKKLTFRLKGGSGSGHYGHSGRPGKHGGSLPGSGGGSGLSSLSSHGYKKTSIGYEKTGAKGRRVVLHDAVDDDNKPTVAALFLEEPIRDASQAV
jgi:hypothetical protein